MKTTTARRIVAASAAMLFVGLLGIAPASAGSPITAPVADPNPVVQGQTFTVSGVADCIDGDTLTIAIEGLGLSDTVSGDNAWSIEFTAPIDAEIGTYPITVDGEECSFPAGSVTVKAADTTTTVAPTTTAPPAAEAAVAASPAFTG